jgi:ribose 5-phosphate isomerase B
MKIALGSDHAGYALKEDLKPFLAGLGHTVMDVGATGPDSCDYPDYAVLVSRAVVSGQAERGVLVCGTGIGMSIAANKAPGVRAAVLYDRFLASISRSHNDVNVACFGARVQTAQDVKALLEIWLRTPFDAGRHALRLDKVRRIEQPGC